MPLVLCTLFTWPSQASLNTLLPLGPLYTLDTVSMAFSRPTCCSTLWYPFFWIYCKCCPLPNEASIPLFFVSSETLLLCPSLLLDWNLLHPCSSEHTTVHITYSSIALSRLKGVCHKIFYPCFFSWLKPIWAPDKQPKVFLNSVSISPRYAITK